MMCPKCKTELHNTATYCGCGWRKRPETSKEFHANALIQCAFEACNKHAPIKVKTGTGWANFCDAHYDEYYRSKAVSSLPKWGMERKEGESTADHVARMRQFVKAGFKGFSAKTMAYAARVDKP